MKRDYPKSSMRLGGHMKSVERELIERGLRFLKDQGTPGILLGVGDDAAVIDAQNLPISISKDAMVEGIHFKRDWSSAQDIGFKLIESSVSDLAAMGARPWVAFLSVAFPGSVSEDWVDGFWEGIAESCHRTSLRVVGGDTTRSMRDLFLSATVIGVHEGTIVKRHSASVGDEVYVTGTLGDSSAGLQILEGETEDDSPMLEFLKNRHRRPLARLEWGAWLGSNGEFASCLDVSDGLVQDLGHIARLSSVGFHLDASKIPMSREFIEWSSDLSESERMKIALTGGEDYELIFTVSPETIVPRFLNGIPATRIGVVIPKESEGTGIKIQGKEGFLNWEKGGWDPFS